MSDHQTSPAASAPLRSALKSSSRPSTPAGAGPAGGGTRAGGGDGSLGAGMSVVVDTDANGGSPRYDTAAATRGSPSSNTDGGAGAGEKQPYPKSAPPASITFDLSHTPSRPGSAAGSSIATGTGVGSSDKTGSIASGSGMNTFRSRIGSGSAGDLVGFDTMSDAGETTSATFSFTLQVKSKDYRRTKNSRTFLCAVDMQAYSQHALDWLMESLVEDGDEIVVLRVLEGDADEIDQGEAREEARSLIEKMQELNEDFEDRPISIVVEFIAGRVTSTILHIIAMYRPDSLIVGTRGKSSNVVQKMFGGTSMGSVSRFAVSHSPVPVVVVRPEAKVKKAREKRQGDPKRKIYQSLIRGDKHLAMSRTKSWQPS